MGLNKKRIYQLLREKRMQKNPEDPYNRLFGLYKLIKKYFKSSFIGVELGSYEGASTELFALMCERIISVDPYDFEGAEFFGQETEEQLHEAKAVFDERMKSYNNCKQINLKSKFAVEQFEHNNLNFVYLDGDHRFTSVILDIVEWYPKIKIGGYICGHDYIDNVKKAINKMLGEPLEVFSDSSWIFKKTDEIF